MRTFLVGLFLIQFLILTGNPSHPYFLSEALASDDSCVCPKLGCDLECEFETQMSFYSEKCEGGTKVKSCSRPTCAKKPDAPAKCNTQASSAKPEIVTEKSPDMERAPAATIENDNVAGRIKFIEGDVKINKDIKHVGDEIREGDKIQTGTNGRVQLLFNSGNIVNVTPNSLLIVTEGSDSIQGRDKKKMVLDLLKGKARSQVVTPYKGASNSFQVRTPTAVAGVRGTDFVVSVFDQEQKLYSQVQTLEGRVELGDPTFLKKVSVTAGEVGVYIQPLQNKGEEEDNVEIVDQGYFASVRKMTVTEVANLRSETIAAFNILDKKNSKEEFAICGNPTGRLNQCSWTCENNPSGAKNCLTENPDVKCVRRVCDANGNWADATRLPASKGAEYCAPDKVVVKPCDY